MSLLSGHEFSPANCLLLVPPDSELGSFLEETRRLVLFRPDILLFIEEDLDQNAIGKKESRLEDRQWYHNIQGSLAGLEKCKPTTERKPFLQQGRPRMSPIAAYFFWMLCVYSKKGVKSLEVRDLLLESKTVELFLREEGISVPGLSTIHENTNAISLKTRNLILDAQIAMAKRDKLENFQKCQVDSTMVDANTAWPTDSGLMWKLLNRLDKRCKKLKKSAQLSVSLPEMGHTLRFLKRLDFQISNTPGSKPDLRKELYQDFFDRVEVAATEIYLKLSDLKDSLAQTQVRPSKKKRLESLFEAICSDMTDLDNIITHSTLRVLTGKHKPVEQRVLSVSDPDAAYLKKGRREARIGYKPQLCRSEKGLVTGVIIPKGNVGDAPLLQELCTQSFERTKVIPEAFSGDGGYASWENRQWLKDKSVKYPSFSSSRGKRITPRDEWESPEYQSLRNWRSAVESMMSHIKGIVGFGKLLRRGIEGVRAELMGKVIAFNFIKMSNLRI